ncbi:MAG: Acylphosphatase [Alphaproteobacteria bacterium MarineAlpha2_Bin1]|nr:MAG: Acylphosphatase [Alphaproteobacteria bacterium MarineAlpha2_Bin1]
MFKINIYGKVQGVSYRAWFKKTAELMDIRGCVYNNDDGSVEALVNCNKEELIKLIGLCHQGSKLSEVNRVEYYLLSDIPLIKNQKGFIIKY